MDTSTRPRDPARTTAGSSAPPAAAVGARSMTGWVAAVTAGEVVGFTVPAGVAVVAADWRAWPALVALVLAGSVEGALLGTAQAWWLRSRVAGFRARAWVVATGAGAAVAWALGMLPATTHDTWSAWPVGGMVAAGGVLAIALLLTIGCAQAAVLPRVLPRGTRLGWVAVTAVGWLVGLGVFSLVTTPWWHEGQSTATVMGIGLVGGVAMALSMALVTGAGARRLAARR